MSIVQFFPRCTTEGSLVATLMPNALLEVNRDGHNLVHAELVHPGGHVAGPRPTVPEEDHDQLHRQQTTAHPHNRNDMRQRVRGVAHASQVEDGGRLAEVDRLTPPHLVVGLRTRVVATSAIQHRRLVDGDASTVDVLVLVLGEDGAVRRGV